MIDIVFVCSKCNNHTHSSKGDKVEGCAEINFRDGELIYICPECKKENKIILKAEAPRLPRIGRVC